MDSSNGASPQPPAASQPARRAPFFSGLGCWGSLAVVLTSLFFFLLACLTPAMVFDKETWQGFSVLLGGWMGFFLGQFAWFANLLYGLSLLLVFLRRWFLALVTALLALAVASDAFSFPGATVPLDEAFVNTMLFQHYAAGFYLWLVSLALVAIGAVVMWVITLAARRRVAASK